MLIDNLDLLPVPNLRSGPPPTLRPRFLLTREDHTTSVSPHDNLDLLPVLNRRLGPPPTLRPRFCLPRGDQTLQLRDHTLRSVLTLLVFFHLPHRHHHLDLTGVVTVRLRDHHHYHRHHHPPGVPIELRNPLHPLVLIAVGLPRQVTPRLVGPHVRQYNSSYTQSHRIIHACFSISTVPPVRPSFDPLWANPSANAGHHDRPYDRYDRGWGRSASDRRQPSSPSHSASGWPECTSIQFLIHSISSYYSRLFFPYQQCLQFVLASTLCGSIPA